MATSRKTPKLPAAIADAVAALERLAPLLGDETRIHVSAHGLPLDAFTGGAVTDVRVSASRKGSPTLTGEIVAGGCELDVFSVPFTAATPTPAAGEAA